MRPERLIKNPSSAFKVKQGTCQEAQDYCSKRIENNSVQLLQQIDYLLNLKDRSYFTVICPDSFVPTWNVHHFVDFLVATTISKNLQIEYVSFRDEVFHTLRTWRVFADSLIDISYEINGQKCSETIGNTSPFPKELNHAIDIEFFIRECYHLRKFGIKDCW